MLKPKFTTGFAVVGVLVPLSLQPGQKPCSGSKSSANAVWLIIVTARAPPNTKAPIPHFLVDVWAFIIIFINSPAKSHLSEKFHCKSSGALGRTKDTNLVTSSCNQLAKAASSNFLSIPPFSQVLHGELAAICNLDGINFPNQAYPSIWFSTEKSSKSGTFSGPENPPSKKPQPHQQITTTSPQKTITQTPLFPKTPSKNALPPRQKKL
jgi:hypothetical protein